jgi:hypothetical protein
LTKPQFAKGPFFIVGCPRSGTTLMQRMLDAHSQIAVAPETFFVRRFVKNPQKYGDLANPRKLSLLLAELTQLSEFKEMGLDAKSFYDRFQGRKVDYGEVFAELLEAWRESRDKPLVGEKTPNHLLYMRDIEDIFENARFIHVIRDPRAVVESWRHVPWSNGSVESDAEVWRRYLATARLSPPRRAPLLEVRYENLVLRPHEELTRLCAFLEVPFEDAMLDFHELGAGAVNVEREPWKSAILNPTNLVALDRWRQKLSRADVARVEAVVYYELTRAGYKVETQGTAFRIAALRRALERRIESWRKERRLRDKARKSDAARRAAVEAAAPTARDDERDDG